MRLGANDMEAGRLVREVNLPLTIPVREIVMSALRALRDQVGLDRDETYLLTRLENGEALSLIANGENK